MIPQPLQRYVPLILIALLTACGAGGGDGDEPTSANQTPVVNAGVDQSVDAGTAVTLSGAAADPDGAIASHAWTQTGGPAVTLAGADSATATFTAPNVPAHETLTFRLTVVDNDGAEASDEMTVRVEWFGFVEVSSGHQYACGLRGTGYVECWGDDDFGEATPPIGTFIQISAGLSQTCGVRNTGDVECWGHSRRATPPVGTFIQVSVGSSDACGVIETGDVACWGHNEFGQSKPPAGAFTSVSTGSYNAWGVLETGEVVCWGSEW